MTRGAKIPGMGLRKVLLHPVSALVKVADLLFGLREILVRRFAVPIEGLLITTFDADTVLGQEAQIVLPERIPLVRRGTIVGQGALVIPRHAELMLIHVAQQILRGSEALVSGLAIPEQSLSVVLGNADAVEIVVRDRELRLRVTGCGGFANRVEVAVQWRRGRLRRVLYRRLRSRGRRGDQ